LLLIKGEDKSGTKVATEKARKRPSSNSFLQMARSAGKDIRSARLFQGKSLTVCERRRPGKERRLLARSTEIYRANYDRMEAMMNSQKAPRHSRARVAQVKHNSGMPNFRLTVIKPCGNRKSFRMRIFDAARSAYEVAKSGKDAPMKM